MQHSAVCDTLLKLLTQLGLDINPMKLVVLVHPWCACEYLLTLKPGPCLSLRISFKKL